MNLKVLGCAGGIGGRERLTTSLLLDHDILLDAGTGLSSLNIDQLAVIDHVFLSHCHLDHVTGLALLLDAVMGKRTEPVTVHATEHVIASLRNHLFNWILWPDFTAIPSQQAPILRWEPIQHGVTINLAGRKITSYPVNHTVDASAYRVHGDQDGFVFSGDMFTTPQLWATLAAQPEISKVIVDCSFPNAESDLADKSRHFHPLSLLNDIHPMAKSVEFLIYHLKPGQEDQIMTELQSAGTDRLFKALRQGDCFSF
jgi:cAMP phosphodiesterase